MSSFVFNIIKDRISKGEINFNNNTDLKLALVNEDLFDEDNIETSSTWDDINEFEISATWGYDTDGISLSGVEVEENNGNFYVKSDKVEFGTNTTISARGAVVYDNSFNDDNLICAIDFGKNVTSSNGVYEITLDDPGFLRIQ
ncbi:MAG: hypothetical protein ACOC33_03640 [bacterium]